MELTDIFVLPAGSVLQPVSELSDELRRVIESAEGDFALSRPNSRAHSKVVDAEAAALLRQFEQPSTIAQAIARFSRGRVIDAEQLLEDALPFLQSLIAERMLVTADSVEALGLHPSLAEGADIDGWIVLRCIQSLEDTEVYQARGFNGQIAALKIGRVGITSAGRTIAWEAAILSRLDSSVTPRVFASGEWAGRPYLLIEWFAGADVDTVCAEFRRRGDADSRGHLLRVTGGILEAYAHLHEQGVTHGDIHPRNVLINRHDAVKIIDLGYAQRIDENGLGDAPQRGGVSFFFEPECARALMEGSPPPPSSLSGEQYGIAAMLFLLLTGSHYLDFLLEKNQMLRQITESPPTAFTQRGVDAWPAVEELLSTALSKDPATRFRSTRDFAHAWRAIAIPRPAPEVTSVEEIKLRDLRADILRNSAIGSHWLNAESLASPTTSLNFGSAGIAYALYRIACVSEDAELLAAADVWSARSVREIGDDGAFYNPAMEITPETVGRNSLYHSPAGVYAVQALIAQARGDVVVQCEATGAFIEVSQQPGKLLDVTLGRAGLLLGCVFLLDALSGLSTAGFVAEQKDRLRTCGDEIQEQLWRTIDGFAPIRQSKELSNLGIAHGWAGLLYATLCWCTATGEPVPDALTERLRQLGECAEPTNRGLQWKWDLGTGGHNNSASRSMPGWCNGSAGYVFLWTAAHRAIGDARYLELAEGAAWHLWETPSMIGNLCCGIAGQAYALLNLYRYTGDTIWLQRAREMASRVAATSADSRSRGEPTELDRRPESLYKGDLGLAVLTADLRRPERAYMPMFEREEYD